MRRYQNLANKDVNDAIEKLCDAFLAAKDGIQVKKIVFGLLTSDERIKIGRRIIIADALNSHMTIEEISQLLSVGRHTILRVAKELDHDSSWFDLINKRKAYAQKKYESKKIALSGGSKLVFKKKTYTGFKKHDVKR